MWGILIAERVRASIAPLIARVSSFTDTEDNWAEYRDIVTAAKYL